MTTISVNFTFTTCTLPSGRKPISVLEIQTCRQLAMEDISLEQEMNKLC